MIALEHLADGSAVDRNFQALTRLVVDTGGISLGLRAGQAETEYPGASAVSGTTVVTHGLGRVPAAIVTNALSVHHHSRAGGTWTAQTFEMVSRTLDGSTPAGGTKMPVSWVVVG